MTESTKSQNVADALRFIEELQHVVSSPQARVINDMFELKRRAKRDIQNETGPDALPHLVQAIDAALDLLKIIYSKDYELVHRLRIEAGKPI